MFDLKAGSFIPIFFPCNNSWIVMVFLRNQQYGFLTIPAFIYLTTLNISLRREFANVHTQYSKKMRHHENPNLANCPYFLYWLLYPRTILRDLSNSFISVIWFFPITTSSLGRRFRSFSTVEGLRWTPAMLQIQRSKITSYVQIIWPKIYSDTVKY